MHFGLGEVKALDVLRIDWPDRLSEAFILTTPPWEAVRWAYDKRLTAALATDLGLDQPRTWAPQTSWATASRSSRSNWAASRTST